ncbi:MAG: 4-phosphopantoate--beta-alanine ligase [Thermoplasmata archaeon]
MNKEHITIPKTHPRYISLLKREKIIDGFNNGIVATAGLIAHGRGETFDYLIGEKTQDFAIEAEKAAIAALKLASNPVISINGNVAALVPDEIINLSKILNAKLELNLFYRTYDRVKNINELFLKKGVTLLGIEPDAKIPGLDHKRALCSKAGIFSADVVLIPLEDGDRALALKNMNKKVIAIDLNPISRTAQVSDITIVNELTRTVTELIEIAKNLDDPENIIRSYNNKKTLNDSLKFIKERLEYLATLP